MSRPNTLLVLVLASLSAVLGLTIWALVDRNGSPAAVAERKELAVAPARPDAGATTGLDRAQEPNVLAEPPADPQHVSVPEKERTVGRAVPSKESAALRFLQEILPERYGALTAAEAAALTTLDLRGAAITDADLAQLAGLPSLESVVLRGTAVTDAGLAHLCSVPKLTAVDLRGTKVSAAGIAALPTNRLEALHLTDTQVNGDDLQFLPALPHLHVFKLNGLKVSDAALAYLDVLPALTHLELDRTAITDAGVRRLLERNPGIQRVELRQTAVTPAAIAELAVAYPNVQLVRD